MSMWTRGPVLLIALAGASCARAPGVPSLTLSYDRAIEKARQDESGGGAFAACIASWREGSKASARRRVLDFVARQDLGRDAIVLAESGTTADFADYYAYALLVNDQLVSGLLTGMQRRTTVSDPELRAALADVDPVAVGRARGEEIPGLSDGDCCFLTLWSRGEMHQVAYHGCTNWDVVGYPKPTDPVTKVIRALWRYQEGVSDAPSADTCTANRAIEVAARSARAAGLDPDRMQVSAVVGPTDRVELSALESLSGYEVDVTVEKLPDVEFFFVLHEPVPRPGARYFGSGHATFVRTSDCSVLATASGV